jgi:hypothetical protein
LLVTTFDNKLLLDYSSTTLSADESRPPLEKRRRTGPNRPITWLPLVPVSLDGPREEMMGFGVEDDVLDYLLALSGGHPRSLALLHENLRYKKNQTLLQRLTDWGSSCVGFIEDIPEEVFEELLASAILSERLRMRDTIGGFSVQGLIQSSVLLNEFNPDMISFYPQMSLLRLYRWCSADKTARSASRDLAACFRSLLEFGQDLQHRPFESFHCLFENLRLWAWHKKGRQGQPVLSEWYWSGALLDRERDFSFSIPTTNLRPAMRCESRLSEGRVELGTGCRLAANDQPGADVFESMGHVLLLCECRYSEPPPDDEKTGTRLSPAMDVRRKVVLASQEVQKSGVVGPEREYDTPIYCC